MRETAQRNLHCRRPNYSKSKYLRNGGRAGGAPREAGRRERKGRPGGKEGAAEGAKQVSKRDDWKMNQVKTNGEKTRKKTYEKVEQSEN